MTRNFFDTFPELWDRFEQQLEAAYLKWLKTAPPEDIDPAAKKYYRIYRDLGWEYWRFNYSDATRWVSQMQTVFFDSKYYATTNLLHDFYTLDTLVAQSLTEQTPANAEDLYRIGVRPHLTARKQELIQKFADMARELDEPKPYFMNQSPDGSSRRFYLAFETRCKNKHAGNGYIYSLNGKTYRDVASLWNEPGEELSKNVQIGTDVYGHHVLRTYTQIPTFDSGDREWDSEELEFLMFDGKDMNLIVMRGGYRIASLTFYEKLLSADMRLKPLFEKLGWPTAEIQWV